MTTPDHAAEAAILAVVHRYALAADDVRPRDVAACFTETGSLTTFLRPGADDGHTLTGREAIAAAMRRLDRYPVLLHEIVQHTARIEGPRAEARTACLAHHVTQADDATWVDRVLAIRYADAFERHDGHWLIARRVLRVLWTEHRPVDR